MSCNNIAEIDASICILLDCTLGPLGKLTLPGGPGLPEGPAGPVSPGGPYTNSVDKILIINVTIKIQKVIKEIDLVVDIIIK